MLRLFAMGRRKPTLTRGDYHGALLHRHAPLVKACEAFQLHCRHYHQNHFQGPVDGDAAQGLRTVEARLDNCSEFWFDDIDAIVRTFAHPSYLQGVRPDEPNWTDATSRIAFVAEETEVPASGPRADAGRPMTKLFVLAPLDPVPGCARQIDNRVLGKLDFERGRLAEHNDVPFTHLSEMWFDTPSRLAAWLASGGCAQLRGEAFWATEHKII